MIYDKLCSKQKKAQNGQGTVTITNFRSFWIN